MDRKHFMETGEHWDKCEPLRTWKEVGKDVRRSHMVEVRGIVNLTKTFIVFMSVMATVIGVGIINEQQTTKNYDTIQRTEEVSQTIKRTE